MRSTKSIVMAKIGYVVMSVMLCAFGLVLVAIPQLSLQLICQITGVVMCVYGGVKIVGYFSRDLYRLAFQFDLAYGLFILVLGITMIVFPYNIAKAFGMVLGVIVLADALFKVQITIDSKKFGINTWWLIALLSIITAGFGIWLIADTAMFAQTTIILAGTALIFEGILNLCVVIFAVKIVKNQLPET